jgi:hypothetical protein
VQDAFEVRERMFEWRDKAFEHFDVVGPLCSTDNSSQE